MALDQIDSLLRALRKERCGEVWGRPHGCWVYRVRETGGEGLRYGRSPHRVGGSQVIVCEGKRTRDSGRRGTQ